MSHLQTALKAMKAHTDRFSDGDILFIKTHAKLFNEFVDKADSFRTLLIKKGARYICEQMRWKGVHIANAGIPLYAHVYNSMSKDREDYFFTIRRHKFGETYTFPAPYKTELNEHEKHIVYQNYFSTLAPICANGGHNMPSPQQSFKWVISNTDWFDDRFNDASAEVLTFIVQIIHALEDYGEDQYTEEFATDLYHLNIHEEFHEEPCVQHLIWLGHGENDHHLVRALS